MSSAVQQQQPAAKRRRLVQPELISSTPTGPEMVPKALQTSPSDSSAMDSSVVDKSVTQSVAVAGAARGGDRQGSSAGDENEEIMEVNDKDDINGGGTHANKEGDGDNIDADNADDDDDEVHFMSSHLDPRTVLWSSDPEHLAPSLYPLWSSGDPSQTPGRVNDNEKENGSGSGLVSMFTVNQPSASAATRSIRPREVTARLRKAAKLFVSGSSGRSPRVLVVAGAGMGCDSGLPDYRSPEGFYRDYPPLRQAGITFAGLSEPSLFREHPRLAWGLYSHRAALYREAAPHPGFGVLRWLEQELGADVFVMTSNIDGHFAKAGFAEERVFETHGSLHRLQCVRRCPGSGNWPLDPHQRMDVDPATMTVPEDQIPRCPRCGAVARPGVSFFADTYADFCPERYFEQKQRLLAWLSQRERPLHGENENTGQSKVAENESDNAKEEENADENNEAKEKDDTEDVVLATESPPLSCDGRPVNNFQSTPTQTPTPTPSDDSLSAPPTAKEPLIILELGCGTSLHSLRWEAEELVRMANDPDAQDECDDGAVDGSDNSNGEGNHGHSHGNSNSRPSEGIGREVAVFGDGANEGDVRQSEQDAGDADDNKDGAGDDGGSDDDDGDDDEANNGLNGPSLSKWGGLAFAPCHLIRVNPAECSVPLNSQQEFQKRNLLRAALRGESALHVGLPLGAREALVGLQTEIRRLLGLGRTQNGGPTNSEEHGGEAGVKKPRTSRRKVTSRKQVVRR